RRPFVPAVATLAALAALPAAALRALAAADLRDPNPVAARVPLFAAAAQREDERQDLDFATARLLAAPRVVVIARFAAGDLVAARAQLDRVLARSAVFVDENERIAVRRARRQVHGPLVPVFRNDEDVRIARRRSGRKLHSIGEKRRLVHISGNSIFTHDSPPSK